MEPLRRAAGNSTSEVEMKALALYLFLVAGLAAVSLWGSAGARPTLRWYSAVTCTVTGPGPDTTSWAPFVTDSLSAEQDTTTFVVSDLPAHGAAGMGEVEGKPRILWRSPDGRVEWIELHTFGVDTSSTIYDDMTIVQQIQNAETLIMRTYTGTCVGRKERSWL
jgi:hypothetical protein